MPVRSQCPCSIPSPNSTVPFFVTHACFSESLSVSHRFCMTVLSSQPSHSDKAANPEVLKWTNDLAKFRKQLKGEQPPLVHFFGGDWTLPHLSFMLGSNPVTATFFKKRLKLFIFPQMSLFRVKTEDIRGRPWPCCASAEQHATQELWFSA